MLLGATSQFHVYSLTFSSFSEQTMEIKVKNKLYNSEIEPVKMYKSNLFFLNPEN